MFAYVSTTWSIRKDTSGTLTTHQHEKRDWSFPLACLLPWNVNILKRSAPPFHISFSHTFDPTLSFVFCIWRDILINVPYWPSISSPSTSVMQLIRLIDGAVNVERRLQPRRYDNTLDYKQWLTLRRQLKVLVNYRASCLFALLSMFESPL